jgi:hypothetical protein
MYRRRRRTGLSEATTKKQKAARAKFARLAPVKGATKVGRRAAPKKKRGKWLGAKSAGRQCFLHCVDGFCCCRSHFECVHYDIFALEPI